jgi:hypothetical protein
MRQLNHLVTRLASGFVLKQRVIENQELILCFKGVGFWFFVPVRVATCLFSKRQVILLVESLIPWPRLIYTFKYLSHFTQSLKVAQVMAGESYSPRSQQATTLHKAWKVERTRWQAQNGETRMTEFGVSS